MRASRSMAGGKEGDREGGHGLHGQTGIDLIRENLSKEGGTEEGGRRELSKRQTWHGEEEEEEEDQEDRCIGRQGPGRLLGWPKVEKEEEKTPLTEQEGPD